MDACHTIIGFQNGKQNASATQMKEDLEHGDIEKKKEMVKQAIVAITNGEQLGPGVLMFIIRFAMPLPDHELKKILMIFWECLPKKSQDGNLLPEMILVW